MVIYVLRNVHTVWLYYRLWVFGHNGGGWDNAVCRVLPRLVRRYTNHYLYHSTTPATLSLLLSPAVATIVSHHHLRAQCFYAILLVLFVCFASDCDSSAPKTMSTLIYFTHFSHCVTRLDFCSVHLFTDGFVVLRCDMSLYNFRWGCNSTWMFLSPLWHSRKATCASLRFIRSGEQSLNIFADFPRVD